MLDGADLSFVFVFGFLVALWSRRLFAAPAVFLVLQYGVLWPLIPSGTQSSDTVMFLVANAVVVWCGSVSGVCAGTLLGSDRLLHRRDAALKPTVIHISLLAAMAAAMWLYVALRSVLVWPWPCVVAAPVAILADAVAWFAWTRPAMYIYFPAMRDIKWFVAAVAVCKFTILAAFCGADYIGIALDSGTQVGLALRSIIVVTITLVIIVVRFSPCYRRLKKERMENMWTPHRAHTELFMGTASASGSSVSISSDDAKNDSDYVEYS